MDPEARETLISQLGSPDEEVRRSAMLALKDAIVEEDFKWLIKPLSDESWRVRKEAIDGASGARPSASLVRRLVSLMDPSHEVTLRNSVVEILEKMGSSAVELLREHLSIGQSDTRKFLVDILGNIADRESIPDLIPMLQDHDNNIRAAAAEALASIGDKSAAKALLDALQEANDWTAYSVLGALASIPAAEALPEFFKYLDKGILANPAIAGIGAAGSLEDGVRLMRMTDSFSRGGTKAAFLAAGQIYARAVLSLGYDGTQALRDAVSAAVDQEVLDYLVNQLDISENPEESRKIVTVLGLIGGTESMGSLLKLIDDDALELDVTAAFVNLARMDVQPVMELLTDTDELVRRRALVVLSKFGVDVPQEKIYPLTGDESGHVRKQAAQALSVLGTVDSVDRLTALLEDEYGDVAQAAAESIAILGKKNRSAVVAKMLPLLESASPGGKALIIRILARVDPEGSEAVFFNALQDVEPVVRAAGISGLKKLKDLDTAVIINSLADEDPVVRVEAALALEDLKVPGSAGPLTAALMDTDPWVRTVAASALTAQPELDEHDLADLLGTDDPIIKTSVIDALASRASGGRTEIVEILRQVFTSETVEIKCAICKAVGKVEGRKTVEFLAIATQDEDSTVRTFAVHALAQSGDKEALHLLEKMSENDPDRRVRSAVRSILSARARNVF